MIYTIALLNEGGTVEETIEFDSVSSFSESYSSTIPQAPVESGTSLSDHITKGNDKFSMSALITNSMFRKKGALIAYVNGEFVRVNEATEPLPTEDPVILMKARLKKLRDDKEIFGIFESLKSGAEIQTTQVNLIYPCVLSELSFDNKDGANAIYPNMSFEKIRVSSVEFEVVKNPSPNLIPYIKSNDNGNKSGTSGSIDSKSDSADTDILKVSKEQAGAMKPDMKEDNAMAKRVEGIQKKYDRNQAEIEAEKAFRKRLDEGKLTYGEGGAFIDKYVEIRTGEKK